MWCIVVDPKMKLKFFELWYQNQKTEEIIPIEHYRSKEVLSQIQSSPLPEQPVTIQDLKMEINVLKTEIKHLQNANQTNSTDIRHIKDKLKHKSQKDKGITTPESEHPDQKDNENQYLMLMNQVTFQK